MRRVDFREAVARMTVETTAFKAKTSMLVDFVTLRALDIRKRRVLMEGRKPCRRVRTGEKVNFLLAPIPGEGQRVCAGSHFNRGVKYVGKRFLSLKRLAVQLEFSRRCRGDDVRLAVQDRGAIDWPHNLARVFVRGEEPVSLGWKE